MICRCGPRIPTGARRARRARLREHPAHRAGGRTGPGRPAARCAAAPGGAPDSEVGPVGVRREPVSDDEGWGVVEGADVPGGCWVHFSAVDVPGYRTLQPGQAVVVDWEERDQDGFAYTATRVSLPPAAPR